jgi:hypothetical protein
LRLLNAFAALIRLFTIKQSRSQNPAGLGKMADKLFFPLNPAPLFQNFQFQKVPMPIGIFIQEVKYEQVPFF